MTSSVTGVYSSNNGLDYLVNSFSDSITSLDSVPTTISAVASIGSYGTSTSSETSKARAPVAIETQSEVNLMNYTTAEIHHHTSAVPRRSFSSSMLNYRGQLNLCWSLIYVTYIYPHASIFTTETARALLPTRTKSEVTVSKHVSLDSTSLLVSSTNHITVDEIHQSSVSHDRFSSGVHNTGTNPKQVLIFPYTCFLHIHIHTHTPMHIFPLYSTAHADKNYP